MCILAHGEGFAIETISAKPVSFGNFRKCRLPSLHLLFKQRPSRRTTGQLPLPLPGALRARVTNGATFFGQTRIACGKLRKIKSRVTIFPPRPVARMPDRRVCDGQKILTIRVPAIAWSEGLLRNGVEHRAGRDPGGYSARGLLSRLAGIADASGETRGGGDSGLTENQTGT